MELSNNRAERSIKIFVMGRRDFLFANTPVGAQSRAVIYSRVPLIGNSAVFVLDADRFDVYSFSLFF